MTYKEYIQNILNTRGRHGCGDEYCEKHHIVPRCMNGTDDEDNLIDLFAREHFVAHKLLADENQDNAELVYAFWMMAHCGGRDYQKRYECTPEEYEAARIVFVEMHSRSFSGENHPMYGKHWSEATRAKMSAAHTNPSEATRKKMSKSKKGTRHPRIIPVYCPELDEYFWGATEVEEKYGIDHSAIAKCCNGKRNHAGRHPITGERLTWEKFLKE